MTNKVCVRGWGFKNQPQLFFFLIQKSKHFRNVLWQPKRIVSSNWENGFGYFKALKKRDSNNKDEPKTIEKSDDPIRMYLREMGGVELLSREGEIAIAKRIEAGKDVMLNALSQSPITAKQFFEWNEKLQKDEILVREIIDIDTNYMEDEETGQISKQKKSAKKRCL